MANSHVIAAVSETLRDRLTGALQPLSGSPKAHLHDLVNQPGQGTTPMVTLFLYDIAEDPTVRNRAKTTRALAGELRIRKQPLGLTLHYMVSAWGGDQITEQLMLGRVMQALYDDAVLDGDMLRGSLAGTDAQLRVSLAPLHLEDRARVWFAIGQTYRLSVNYEVRVVNVDAEAEQHAAPVRERTIGSGVVE